MGRGTYRSLFRVLVAWVLAATVVVVGGPGPIALPEALAAPGDAPVTGVIFLDFDRDGKIDPGEQVATNDVVFPSGGVTVTAYDAAGGSSVGTISNGVDGAEYSVDITGLAGSVVRVELEFDAADIASGWTETFVGDDHLGRVSFAAAGESRAFGILPPSQCPTAGAGADGNANSASGKVWTTCFVNGDRSAGGPQDVLVGVNFDNSGGAESISGKSSLGSVWGIGYDEWDSVLFTSAYLKRHVELGPEGLDGLYWFVYPDETPFQVSLENLGGASFGTIGPRDADTANFTAPSNDPEAFAKVGKVGIGDIDVSPDGKTLFVTNIFAKAIQAYDVSDAHNGNISFVGSYSISDGEVGCPDGSSDWYPFAVEPRNGGSVLVGVSCTAEASGARANLAAIVLDLELEFTGPNGTAIPVSSSKVHQVSLAYDRACPNPTLCALGGLPPLTTNGAFLPWADSLADMFVLAGQIPMHPSAVFSDINIEPDGSLTLTLLDRLGDQTGDLNYPTTGTTPLLQGRAAGEIIKVCNTSGDPDNPAWVTEGGGGCAPNFAGGGSLNSSLTHAGPGGGEFYGQEEWQSGHPENTVGGAWTHPYVNEVVQAAFDPVDSDPFFSGGLSWYNTQTGAEPKSRTLYSGRRTGDFGLDPGYVGKANGIGDVQGCFIPVSIGNYVWLDADFDGIQDPDEIALADVNVTVTGPGVNVTVPTDANGLWSVDTLDGLTHGSAYTITIDPTSASNLPPGVTAASLAGTVPDATTDGSDNDLPLGSLSMTTPVLVIGEANNDFDAGLAPPKEYDLALAKVIDSVDVVGGDIHVTYSVAVQNQGNVPSEAFTVTDQVPAGMSFISASNGGDGTTTPGVVTWNVASADELLPDERVTFTLVLQMDDPTQAPFTNVAEITADDPLETDDDSVPDGAPDNLIDNLSLDDLNTDADSNSPDEDDHDIAVFDPAYDLALANILTDVTDTGTAYELTYEITVKNQGDLQSGTFDVTDELAPGTTFVSASNGGDGTTTPGIVTWTIPVGDQIGPMEVIVLTLVVSVDDLTQAPFTNTAEVSSDTGNDDDSTPDTTLTGAGADNLVDITDVTLLDTDGPAGIPPAGDEDDHDIAVWDPEYDLALVKIQTNAAVDVTGTQLTYEITVANQGDLRSGAFEITDTLAAGTSFVSASNAGDGTTTAGLVVWDINVADELASGETLTLTLVVSVDDFTQAPFINTAEVTDDSGVDDDSDPTVDTTDDLVVDSTDVADLDTDTNTDDPDEDDHDIAVWDPSYDLALANILTDVSVDLTTTELTYEIMVKNQGDLTSGDFDVTNEIPAGTSFVSASNGGDGTTTPGIVTWEIDALDGINPGEMLTLTLVVEVDDFTQGPYTNTTEVSDDAGADDDSTPDTTLTGAGADNLVDITDPVDLETDGPPGVNTPDEDDHDIAVWDPAYDLALAKVLTDSDSTGAATILTYGITVANQGDFTSGDFQVTDELPAGTSFVSASNAGDGTTTPGIVTWDIAAANGVNPGDTITLTLEIQVDDPSLAPFTNTAEISDDAGDDDDSTPDTTLTGAGSDTLVDITDPADLDTDGPAGIPPAGDEDDHDIAVWEPTYDLALANVLDSISADGEEITYQIIVKNQGDLFSNTFDVTDELAPGTSFVSASNGGDGTTTPGIVTWTIPVGDEIGPGEMIMLSLTVQIDDASLAPFTNTAEISSSTGTDDDSTPDTTLTGLGSDTLVDITDPADLDTDGPPGVPPAGDEDDHDIVVVEVPLYRIGNLIWLDANDDGIADDGEPGIEGVNVILLDENGAPTGQTDVTDADGKYDFGDLPAGVYTVSVPYGQTGQLVAGQSVNLDDLLISSVVETDSEASDNDNNGTDVPGDSRFEATVTIGDPSQFVPAEPTDEALRANGPGALVDDDDDAFDDTASNFNVDIGFVQPLRVGNIVWLDDGGGFGNGSYDPADENNGTADPQESGIPGVLVQLLDDGGTVIAETVTDVNGQYVFDGLRDGTYQIGIPESQTPEINPPVTGIDAAALTDRASSAFTSATAEAADDDDDGAPSGAFFSLSRQFDLDYGVEADDEAGDFSEGTVGAAEAAANAAASFVLDSNSSLEVDFGVIPEPLYRIGNLVWVDANDNGIADEGELGIEGVEVTLVRTDEFATFPSVFTDADGKYEFVGLPAGDYLVGIQGGQTGQTVAGQPVDLDDLLLSSVVEPDAELADNDNNGSLGGPLSPTYIATVTVGDPDQFTPAEPTDEVLRANGPDALVDDDDDAYPDAKSNFNVDIGFVQPLRVGNLVWLDDGGGFGNGGYVQADEDNGIADPQESGIAGVLVQLLDTNNAVIAETVTGTNGEYLFDDLRDGTYRVAIPSDQTADDTALQPSIVATALDELGSSTSTSADVETADDDDDGDQDLGWASISAPFALDYGLEADDELGDFSDPTAGAAETAANAAASFVIDNNSSLEVDFGFTITPKYRIGNLVWEDYNNNGIAEDGEPGIEGVLVQLLDDTDTVIAETVTDADGHYEFLDLMIGEYRILIPADQTADDTALQPSVVEGALDDLEPSGTPVGDPDAAGDVDNDNNGVDDNGDILSGVLSLGDGPDDHSEIEGETLRNDLPGDLDEDAVLRDDRSNLAVDIGLFRGLRIGNQVFLDGNQGEPLYNNGVFDAGEIGIGGVTVELWIDSDGSDDFNPGPGGDTFVTDTTTDVEGNYFFDDLDPGVDYILAIEEVPTNEPGDFSSTGQSTDPTDSDNDDDGDPAAGYASVSDVITLTVDGATESETDTVPADDAEAEANLIGAFYPDRNSELAVDFGFVDIPLYRIGNLVWEDLNNDGVAQDGEPGLVGVLVQLIDDNGDVIGETATDADGKYVFENLVAGDYTIRIPTNQDAEGADPAGFVAGALDGFQSSTNDEETAANDDGDNNDNGLGLTDWESSTVSVGETLALPPAGDEPDDETLRDDDATDDDPDLGEPGNFPDSLSNLTVDFGFFRLTLGNQVFFDTNDNGVADPGEPGIPDVIVELLDENGTVIATDTTEPDGTYLFEGLLPDTEYIVQIPASEFGPGEPLEDLFSSTDPDTGAIDPDGDETTPGDGVDGDDNGVDPASQGDPVQSLSVVLFIGDEPTGETPDNGNGGEDESQNLTVDLGFHNGLRIGSLVWFDDGNLTVDDENGIADPSEDGIDDVVVQLFSDDGTDPGVFDAGDTLVDTQITAGGGLYEFEHLSPDTYFVVIPESEFETGEPLFELVPTVPSPGADDDINNDSDGQTAVGVGTVTEPIVLSFGDEPDDEANNGTTGAVEEDGTYSDTNSNLSIDLGFIDVPTYRIGNLVWEDLNNNGTAETGEPGIDGVLVQLLDSTGDVVAEQITDADGNYAFEDLLAGDYSVRIPSDQVPEDVTLIPDPAALEGLLSSSNNEEADPDGDGDNNDNGLGLSDWNSGLLTVGEDPFGGEPDDETLRDNDPTDDDLDGPTGWPDDRSNLTVDFGFYGLTLGDQVFFDTNDNGVLDPGEVGINDVVVELVDGNGTVVDTAITSGNGNYLFIGLTEGDEYVVQIPASEFGSGEPLEDLFSSTDPDTGAVDPDGDEATPGDGVDGDDNGVDPVSQGDPVQSLPIVLFTTDEPTGETPDTGTDRPDDNENQSLDFGFHNGLRIGSLVWFDDGNLTVDDENGIADPSEGGIDDVVVQLFSDDGTDPGVLDADDTLVDTVVTAGGGLYEFEHLSPDTYFVVIPESEFETGEPLFELVRTLPGTGADDDVNNDSDGEIVAGVGTVTEPIVLSFGDEPDDEANNGTTGVVEEDGTYSGTNSNLSIDLGFIDVPTYRIGNLVWEDLNNNGIAETGEPGIDGVLVQLIDEFGDPLAELVTDANGNYAFEDLLSGEYRVRIPSDQTPVVDLALVPDPLALEGLLSSSNGQEIDPDDDGDNNDNGLGTTDWTSASLEVGEDPFGGEPDDETLRDDDLTDDDLNGPTGWPDDRSNLTVDFGFYGLTLGDQVFFDTNDNGVLDPGEVGINDVVVELVDSNGTVVDTAITSGNGNYLFIGLTEGDEYVVQIPASEFGPAAPLEDLYSSTDPTTGTVDPDGDETVPGDGVDGDDNGIDQPTSGPAILSEPIVLFTTDEPTGETPDTGTDRPDDNENQSLDFGFHNGLRIGSTVWLDDGHQTLDDENGIADPSEEGLPDVTVELWLDDGDGVFDPNTDTSIDEMDTDPDGLVEFEHLPVGVYFLVVPEEESDPGGDLDGLVSTFDGADDDTTNNDDNGTPVPGVGLVSDPIDLDYDTEPGDEGVDGTTGVDEEDGNYADENSNYTVDFGMIEQPTYRIGNLVWEDLDHDGFAEDGEPGIEGVLVQLLDESGDPIAETLTDPDGAYDFDELEAGDYQVRIPSDQTPVVDTALVPTPDALDALVSSTNGEEADADDDVDNNDNGLGLADWTSSVVTIGEDVLDGEPVDETVRTDDTTDSDDDFPIGQSDGRSNYSVDFGFYRLSLGNQVFFDWNNSGDSDDPSEVGIPEVLVNLIDAATGDIVESLTTDPDGLYLFDGLTDGVTYVVEIDPTNFEPGGPLEGFHSTDGPNVGEDPDDDPTDDDHNGSQGSPEDGVRTDPITMVVGEEPTNEPGIDNDPLTPDENENRSVDFGFYTLTVGNSVWLDTDDDGQLDPGEPGVPGVTVHLIDNNTGEVIDTVETDPDGAYLFTGLPEGEYVIEVPEENFLPDPDGDGPEEAGPLYGLSSSPPTDDPDDTPADDDDNGVEDGPDVVTEPFELVAGEAPPATGDTTNADPDVPLTSQNLNVDLGFHGLSLGNLVFIDLNADGVFDETTEAGRPEVTVELWLANEAGEILGSTPFETTVTDDDGHYLFTDLDPQTYVLVVPADEFQQGQALFGFISTDGNGVDAPDPDTNTTDSDDNGDPRLPGATWSDPVTLEPAGEPLGETDISNNPDHQNAANDPNTNLTVDFGFEPRPGISLGNRIWNDLDGDGIQDPDEPGIDGVRVELIDEAGDPVTFDITDNEGYYLFPGLDVGTYNVVVPASNFDEPIDALWGMFSPDNEDIDPEDNVDFDENGTPPAEPFGDIVSLPVTLIDLFEPQFETDIEPPGLNIPSDPNDNLTVDFGFVTVSLGGTIFNDPDEDGTQDPTDDPIPGVVVNLLDDQGEPVLDGSGEPVTTVTEPDGTYLFEGLEPGTYIVEVPTDSFEEGEPLDYTSPTRGNNDPNTGVTPDPDDDTDGDDNGDPVSPDVFAEEPVRSQPVTVTIGTEPEGETSDIGSPTVPDSNENLTVDIGFVKIPLHELGGVIWIDTDNSGDVGPDEQVAPGGVTLTLLDGSGEPVLDTNGIPITTTTNPDGTYVFTELPHGTYIVQINPENVIDGGALEGLWPSTGPSSSADPNDDLTDVNDGVGQPNNAIWSGPVVLYPETEPTGDPTEIGTPDDYSNLTVDFGVYNVTIEGTIWLDVDDDGEIDDLEQVGEGVEVHLVHPDGTPVLNPNGDPVIATTDENGEYLFEDVADGEYLVMLPAANFEPEAPLDNLKGTKAPDNDRFQPDGSYISVPFIVSAAVQGAASVLPAADLGFRPITFAARPEQGAVNGTFWLDEDTNGQRNPNEPVFERVVEVVIQVPGEPGTERRTVTNGYGYWEFPDVDPGIYIIGFELPDGTQLTLANVGLEDTDSDAAPGRPVDFVLLEVPRGSIGVIQQFTVTPTGTHTFDIGLTTSQEATPAVLAFTGSSAAQAVLLGIALMLSGLAFVGVGRHRVRKTDIGRHS